MGFITVLCGKPMKRGKQLCNKIQDRRLWSPARCLNVEAANIPLLDFRPAGVG